MQVNTVNYSQGVFFPLLVLGQAKRQAVGSPPAACVFLCVQLLCVCVFLCAQLHMWTGYSSRVGRGFGGG